MHLTISHTTRYIYDEPIHYGLQKVRLIPRDSPLQRVSDWRLEIAGGKREAGYHDQHGNVTELVSTAADATEITITAQGRVETRDTAGVLGHVFSPVPLWHYRQPSPLTAPGAGILSLSEPLAAAGDKLDALHRLSEAIGAAVEYGAGQTYAGTPAEEALEGGKGVCQDHAQIFISASRAAGLPARYVSGYLMMDGQDDQDATHAWAEAYLDTLGWVGFDVSNAQCPDERYVRLAAGRDYREAAPVSGMRQGKSDESMIVSLQVQQ